MRRATNQEVAIVGETSVTFEYAMRIVDGVAARKKRNDQGTRTRCGDTTSSSLVTGN